MCRNSGSHLTAVGPWGRSPFDCTNNTCTHAINKVTQQTNQSPEDAQWYEQNRLILPPNWTVLRFVSFLISQLLSQHSLVRPRTNWFRIDSNAIPRLILINDSSIYWSSQTNLIEFAANDVLQWHVIKTLSIRVYYLPEHILLRI